MFIETEQTPNPATLKFLPGRSVMASGTADFTDAEKAERSPLAARLFLIEGVTGVFLGTDFVTVSKADGKAWQVLKPAILGVIMEHFAHKLAVEFTPERGTIPFSVGTCRLEALLTRSGEMELLGPAV